MATVVELSVESPASSWTVADLMERFGPMRLSRIRFDPFPGTATEQDVLDLLEHNNQLYELVDGVLVGKAMGFPESCLAASLIAVLKAFVSQHRLGTVTAPDGLMRLAPGLVRIPDVAFIRWEQFPNRQIPRTPVPSLAPDLAIEVLSPSNTEEEMERKRQDYFGAGCKLVWLVDPDARTVTVYAGPDQPTVLREDQTLDGGTVLPGFALPLRQLFAELDPH
jgi:Uma2 family endonuclease